MIAQAVIASYNKTEPDGFHFGQLTVTGVSPCPYGTYINYHKLDPQVVTPLDRLRMKNGHYQEAEVLDDIRHAGFITKYTGANQRIVHIGRSAVSGKPDGAIEVDGREDMLEIKAKSLNLYTKVKQKGIDAVPFEKCQVQLYMSSKDLDHDRCWYYFKHKDSCRPEDLEVSKDLVYSRPILEALDSIILDKWEVPHPEQPLSLCVGCRHTKFCWKDSVIVDTTGIKVVSLPEAVSIWKEGRFHKKYGETLIEEAREVLVRELGDEERLLADDLRVLRINQKRVEIDVDKFVNKYGAKALAEIQTTKIVKQVRISQLVED